MCNQKNVQQILYRNMGGKSKTAIKTKIPTSK